MLNIYDGITTNEHQTFMKYARANWRILLHKVATCSVYKIIKPMINLISYIYLFLIFHKILLLGALINFLIML